MTLEMTDAEVINEAIRLIETFGWRQGSNGDRERGFCMSGALLAATGCPDQGSYLDSPVEVERWSHLSTLALDKLVKTPGTFCQMGGITTWNDRPDRTKDEVITFLRQLATEVA